MNPGQPHTWKPLGKGLVTLIVAILILRITSYFMISESVAITRAFKIGVRILLTGGCWLTYRWLRNGRNGLRYRYKNLPALFFYMMYLLLGFASLLWTSSLSYSALQWVMDFECVIFCYYFWKLSLLVESESSSTYSFTKALGVAISLILVVFVIGMFIDPEKFYRSTHGGAIARLGGFIINPNELGMLIVVGAACLYREMDRLGSKAWHVLALLILVYTLVLTGSRSSMISFFAVTGFFVLVAGNYKLKLGSVIAGIMAVPFVIQEVFIKEGDVEEVMSMTGRLPFWKDLLTYGFPQRPFLGYGFMRISETDKFESLHAYAGAMTHNTFLQVLMNLGIVGATIVFLQMTFTVSSVLKERSTHLRRMFVGVFIPIFVNSLTEFGIFGETNYGIMFYLFLIFSLVMRLKNGEVDEKIA